MSFLSKLGSIFSTTKKVVEAITPVVPIAAGLLPTGSQGRVLDIFAGTSAIVGNVEGMFSAAYGVDGKKGADKLKAALPYVAGIVTVSDYMLNKKVIDQAAFESGLAKLVDAVVAINKSVVELTPEEMNRRLMEMREVNAKMSGQYGGGNGQLSNRLVQ